MLKKDEKTDIKVLKGEDLTETREDAVSLPGPLRNVCLIFAAMGSLFLFAGVKIVSSSITLGVASIVVAVGFFAYATAKFLAFSRGKYKYIDGICIDSNPLKLLSRSCEILITTADNDTYALMTPKKKQGRLLPGDKVTVYMPMDVILSEKEGIKYISAFYGYERHR